MDLLSTHKLRIFNPETPGFNGIKPRGFGVEKYPGFGEPRGGIPNSYILSQLFLALMA